ncbi:MAG: hypothetical protein CMJ48_11460, partial [Planctomycetaceae bacterium]|nr:hypothetical protein [Planctomycetaceae bacterium]
MAELTPQHTPLYIDGADHPTTPEKLAAEHAYRQAFLVAARETTKLTRSDESTSIEAMFQRAHAKRRAEIDVGNGRFMYRVGHEVAASRTRGRHHAYSFASQLRSHDHRNRRGSWPLGCHWHPASAGALGDI